VATISPAPSVLRSDTIVAALGSAPKLTVEVVDAIDSTNSELLRRATRQSVHRHALVAEQQTAGRGRRGRSWTAVAGGSLAFSLGWRFEQGAGQLSGVTLAAGLAVARALDAAGIGGIELKWPNDVVHSHAKLGGVLVELEGDALGPSVAIVGVGLNVELPESACRAIGQPVTDLVSVSTLAAIDRNRLLGAVLGELARVLEAFASHGFEPLRADWQSRHALQRKRVQILLPDGGSARGEVIGVDVDGALVLDNAGQRLRFVSGEVSLARLEK
jgi:BirA family transcriptional regulator, biotin operon repressor / biotin---[acetyl-CoA-carboxylase] ligase